MTQSSWARRTFLKKAGQGMAALPLLSMLPEELQAQSASKTNAKHPSTPATPKSTVQLNVRDLGATGDGKTKDTLAIQQALDRCNVLGGGEVRVPPGDYLTAALVLRSNTTLRLDEGASLMGSPDIADYPMTQVRWEGR